MMRVVAVDHFVLRVRDVERAITFYRDVLGLRIECLEEFRAGARPFVSARVGGQLIDLVPDAAFDAQEAGRGGLLHFCLQVEGRLSDIVPELKRHSVEVIEEAPVPRLGAHGMGLAIYVRDPDGYVVELKEASTS